MRTAFRVACQTEAAQMPHGGAITALAVAAGGERLYAGSSTGHVLEYRLRHSTHLPHRPTMPSPSPPPSASPSADTPAAAAVAADDPVAGAVLLAACKAVGKRPVEVRSCVCVRVCVCVLSPSTWTRTQGFAVVSRAGYTRTATHSEVWTEAALCPSVCQAICLLPAARMLAALSDGAVSLMDVDTLQVIQMPAIKVHPPPPLLPVQFAREAPRPVAMVWFSRRGRRTRLRRPLPPSPPNMACMGSFMRSSFNKRLSLGMYIETWERPSRGGFVCVCVWLRVRWRWRRTKSAPAGVWSGWRCC